MPCQSIDVIQNMLADTLFSHTASSKKAAGRALGTIVEIISFYLIKAWGHEYKTAIERPLPEYANSEITHNVEFTFHRSKFLRSINIPTSGNISSTKIYNAANFCETELRKVNSRNLLEKSVIKNACTVAESDVSFCNAYYSQDKKKILLYELANKPYAMFECKRVGVEEGMSKGPQTIEKAKQGAYVARTVSSIQRIRRKDGGMAGVVEHDGKMDFHDDYNVLVEELIFERKSLLIDFILTIGIVSNHGNWFTSSDQNKEMKVLAQSYDWLLFLTDDGLAKFIHDIINNEKEYGAIYSAFRRNYVKDRGGKTCFTKTNMDFEADRLLTKYFVKNLKKIEAWFNVIAPSERHIDSLNKLLIELHKLEV